MAQLLLVSLLLSKFYFSSATCPPAAESSLQQLIDSNYKDLVEKSPWMGISVAVYTPDCGESYFNYGVQNQTSTKVSEDTIFALNSMTKVFTGVSLAYLRTKELLNLTDRIQPFIPNHHMPVDSKNVNQDITFLDLATHWSGLTRVPTNLNYDLFDDPYQTYTDADFFSDLNTYNFTDLHIGQQYLYSNFGFGLLGYILSDDMSGQSFGEMIRSIILNPLNMSSSALTTDEKVPTFACGHDYDGQVFPWGYSCETVLGSWGVRSTARDVLKFLKANTLLHDYSTNAGLMDALELTQVPQRATDEDEYQIGLGWRIADDGTRLKSGSGDGFESIMFFNRGDKPSSNTNTNTNTTACSLGLVILSNSYIESPYDTTTTGSDIFNQLLKQYQCV